jgi:hypothetical protein
MRPLLPLIGVLIALPLVAHLGRAQEKEYAHTYPVIVDVSMAALRAKPDGHAVLVYQVPHEGTGPMSVSLGRLIIVRLAGDAGEITKTTLAATFSAIEIPKDRVLVVSVEISLFKEGYPLYKVLTRTVRKSDWARDELRPR